jgi:hypothetical protein
MKLRGGTMITGLTVSTGAVRLVRAMTTTRTMASILMIAIKGAATVTAVLVEEACTQIIMTMKSTTTLS